MNLFNFESYREYLKSHLESFGQKSGMKRKAAEALQVHTTFISQVVQMKADLSLDQAERMNQFLKHDEMECEYFIDLLLFERATDRKLKERLQKRLKNHLGLSQQIKKRLGHVSEIHEADQEKYYSSSIYSQMYVLASIPKNQTHKSLQEACGLSKQKFEEALLFLLRIGLLKIEKEKIVPGTQHVHLDRGSRFISQHHTNWRMEAIRNLNQSTPEDLHYSLNFSCSEGDAAKISESLLQHLKSLTQTAAKSKEEGAYVYCFDFFRWK